MRLCSVCSIDITGLNELEYRSLCINCSSNKNEASSSHVLGPYLMLTSSYSTSSDDKYEETEAIKFVYDDNKKLWVKRENK